MYKIILIAFFFITNYADYYHKLVIDVWFVSTTAF